MNSIIEPRLVSMFYNKKAYHVEIQEGKNVVPYLFVNEVLQDKNNNWYMSTHNIFFIQGDELYYFLNDCGGSYVDKVLKHLDQCGILK